MVYEELDVDGVIVVLGFIDLYFYVDDFNGVNGGLWFFDVVCWCVENIVM